MNLTKKLSRKFYSSYENSLSSQKIKKNKYSNILTINNYNIIELEEDSLDANDKNKIIKKNILDEENNPDFNCTSLVESECLNCNLFKFLRNEVLIFDNVKNLQKYLCKAFNNEILCISKKYFLNNKNEYQEFGDRMSNVFENSLILCKSCFLNLINKKNFLANIKNLFKKSNNNYFLNNNNSISINLNKITNNVSNISIEINQNFSSNDPRSIISANLTNSQAIITPKPKSEESPIQSNIKNKVVMKENKFVSKKFVLNKISNESNEIHKQNQNNKNKIFFTHKIKIVNINNDSQLDIKNNLSSMAETLKLILLETAFFVEMLIENIRNNFLNNNHINNQIMGEMNLNCIYKPKFEISYKLFEQLINKYQLTIMKYERLIFNIKTNLAKIVIENSEDKKNIEYIKEEINNIEKEFICVNSKFNEILNNFMRNFQILLGDLKRP